MKTVLITGAAGGMGRAAAELFVKEGYRVFALDIRECGVDGVVPLVADVRSEESLQAAFVALKQKAHTLDAIIHFAGLYMLDSLFEIESERLERIFDVNFTGVCRINKIFFPLLHTGSHILITTSELATIAPLPFTGIYAVTKAALDKYAFSLRMEAQLLGIKVSVLRAGAVSTDMLGVSKNDLDRFCDKTQIYKCNAERFKNIVNKIESKSVPASKIAQKTLKIAQKSKPKFAYYLNRNLLLRIYGALPHRLQLFAIRLILK